MRWVNNTISPSNRSPDGWGRQIRSYVVGRSAKDLRTGVEQDMDRTLDGDIDKFLRAALTLKGVNPTTQSKLNYTL